MFKKMVLVLMLQLLSLSAFSGTVICGNGVVSGVIVTGDRSDSNSISNKLFVILDDAVSSTCTTPQGKKVKSGYLENTSSVYDSVLSIASMAFATQRNIQLVIDDGSDMNGVDETGARFTDSTLKSFRIESIVIR